MREVPSTEQIGDFRRKLLDWSHKSGRDYPWRQTNDPFRVLIAEMMLRRTKADQVCNVYHNLFKQYPDVESMAKAPDKDLEQIVYPLGLKWRNPAFKLVAQKLKEKYECKVPQTRDALMTLPGVGDYVAGAVLSIGYQQAEWIVDSNIVRLFRRYFGIKTSQEGRRDKHVIEMARMYVSGTEPRKANLAILDFAALVCLPSNPKCEECPLAKGCATADTLKKGKSDEL